jgi:hypothetical protein
LEPTFPFKEARELVAGAALDVPAGVLLASLVVGAEVAAVPALIPVVVFALLLDATVTPADDVAAAPVADTLDVLPAAVLGAAVSDCTGPVPAASWGGGGQDWKAQ